MRAYTSSESLFRPEVLRWAERIKKRHTPVNRPTVFFECSAKKPYSESKSHRKYLEALGSKKKYVNQVILTSPLGLVPRELEATYPANCYDVPVTGEWSQVEKNRIKELLENYLTKLGKQKLYAHVSGELRTICQSFGMKLTVGENEKPTSPQALKRLSEALREVPRRNKKSLKEKIGHVTLFQFGTKISPESPRRVRLRILEHKTHWFNQNTRKGKLTLTRASARKLFELGKNVVETSFDPKTDTLFSPGVKKASREIRPKDEVIIVYKNRLVGWGEALLSGKTMEMAEKGAAVKIKKLVRQAA